MVLAAAISQVKTPHKLISSPETVSVTDFCIIIYFIFYYLFIYFFIIIYCIIYLFLYHTHNYMNCYESPQVHPATTILGHTLVTLRNKGRYERALVHPVFRTGAQQAHWTRECQLQNGIPGPLYGNIQLPISVSIDLFNCLLLINIFIFFISIFIMFILLLHFLSILTHTPNEK